LQVSVPGQAVMSAIVPAPADASPIAPSASKTAGRSASAMKRSTMFCSTVVRIRSPEYARAMSAKPRACSLVRSPIGR
jgi:hypothetical protein